MEKLYFYEENYDDFLAYAKIIGTGTESVVLEYQEYVYKILIPEFRELFLEKKLRKLATLTNLEEFMTIPVGEVYLDFHFIGYIMKNAGISWKKFLEETALSDEMKIELLKKGKMALNQIHNVGIVHGDIQFGNLMIKDDQVKVSDINNVNYKWYRGLHFNDVTEHLVPKYGPTYLLDLHMFNYITYLLMNVTSEKFSEYLTFDAASFNFFNPDEIENRYFDPEVTKEQLDLLLEPKSKKYALEHSKYLIDYINIK